VTTVLEFIGQIVRKVSIVSYHLVLNFDNACVLSTSYEINVWVWT